MSAPTAPASYDAEFFLDTGCPWCWVTSRWVTNVQSERELSVRWRFISLMILNEDVDNDYVNRARPTHLAMLRILRACHEVREREGNDALGRLYTAIGTELHVHGRGDEAYADVPAFLSGCLSAVGLDPAYAAHADDESHDAALRAETEEALARTGADVGTPIITFGPGSEAERSFFGPVMPRAPKGDDAVALWNAVATLAHSDVAELKRTLRGDLDFG